MSVNTTTAKDVVYRDRFALFAEQFLQLRVSERAIAAMIETQKRDEC